MFLLLLPLAMNTFLESSAHQFLSLAKWEEKYHFSLLEILGDLQSTLNNAKYHGVSWYYYYVAVHIQVFQ